MEGRSCFGGSARNAVRRARTHKVRQRAPARRQARAWGRVPAGTRDGSRTRAAA